MDSIQTNESQGRVSDAPSGHWTYRLLPRGAWPFAQLARWDRPVGWWLLLWPCWWSAALAPLALSGQGEGLPFWALIANLWHLLLFMIGAVAMRGAGCTYNDLVDQNIDDKVARTRSRPLPSGKVTRLQAKTFLVAQAFIGFLVLMQFNRYAIIVGLCSLIVVAIYPFMKRLTDWPQLFLGFAFSWGAWMGWAALYGSLSLAPALLYVGCIFWTIGYDTIYAHQDKEDDALVGVRSTARLFAAKTKLALGVLYTLTLLFFVAAFYVAGTPWPAYAGLTFAGLHLARQIAIIDIDNGDQCLALFKSNTVVGWIIFIGLIGAGAFEVAYN
ncbi:MAG: 4-hydroxybenzoate octaprenyltransferase [Ahrensia sp.]|nr:4-hydroxybenzoate octaprenyltransferase [Ahrensia sp.]